LIILVIVGYKRPRQLPSYGVSGGLIQVVIMISMQSTSGIPPTGIVVSILWLGIIRIDMNTLPPGVDGESRRLELTGMVKNPLSLALAELRAHPPSARLPGGNGVTCGNPKMEGTFSGFVLTMAPASFRRPTPCRPTQMEQPESTR
jgi:hypothetical protein